VRGLFACVSPADLGDLDHLAMAIHSLELAAVRVETHPFAEPGFVGDIAIVDIELIAIDPFVLRLREAMADSADTFGVDIAFGVLPAFLEIDIDLRFVVASKSGFTAEACSLDASLFRRDTAFIIKHDTLRTFGERDADIDGSIGILGGGDRFDHLAEEESALDEHLDIDDAHDANLLHASVEAGAGAIATTFRLGGARALLDASHAGVGIRDGPRGDGEVERGILLHCIRWGEDIESFGLAAE